MAAIFTNRSHHEDKKTTEERRFFFVVFSALASPTRETK